MTRSLATPCLQRLTLYPDAIDHHVTQSEESVSYFFREVHEMYNKLLMNPFYQHGDTISSEVFQARVVRLMRSIT